MSDPFDFTMSYTPVPGNAVAISLESHGYVWGSVVPEGIAAEYKQHWTAQPDYRKKTAFARWLRGFKAIGLKRKVTV